MEEITIIDPRVPLKAYRTRVTFFQEAWSVRSFQRWIPDTLTGIAKSRCLEKVTQIVIDNDVLDSPLLSEQEKRSALRFIVYKFPFSTKETARETEAMRALLKEKPTKREREACNATIKTVQK